jgi:ABC-type lipoprotein export system ATPase subunit
MTDSIQFITKIEINNLWDRYDLVWNLDRHVNILSGINGIGKSTVLNIIGSIISEGTLSEKLTELIDIAVIKFDNKHEIRFTNGRYLIERAKTNEKYRKISDSIKEANYAVYEKLKSGKLGIIGFDDNLIIGEWNKQIPCNLISTFDKLLKESSLPDENVKTELDKDIYLLQKQYLDYQLNIGKKAFEVVSKSNGSNSMQAVLDIKKQQERFLEIMDSLFHDTDKKIDRTKNEIAFICGGKTLTPYQLSSGEKQILVILLTVLIQNNKSSILFMDEPEISLHIDWQKKLIQYIKELNPNVQIILATHSPAVVMEGWLDKVSEMSDLITLDRKAK